MYSNKWEALFKCILISFTYLATVKAINPTDNFKTTSITLLLFSISIFMEYIVKAIESKMILSLIYPVTLTFLSLCIGWVCLSYLYADVVEYDIQIIKTLCSKMIAIICIDCIINVFILPTNIQNINVPKKDNIENRFVR